MAARGGGVASRARARARGLGLGFRVEGLGFVAACRMKHHPPRLPPLTGRVFVAALADSGVAQMHMVMP